MSFLDELKWRGSLHQTTGEEALRAHLEAPGRVGYCGFDPTADSLTVGHLVPIIMLRRFQQAGHKPVALIGGATGLIGDPSGKDAERTLQTREHIEANAAGQRKVLERFIDFGAGAQLVNNADWLEKLSYIDVLRTVGKHFSINAMIQRDSVRTRLESREQGISYTEFSYMLLQAYDFLHLHKTMNVSLQMAGSDQFGNIASGVDLIRREAQGAGHEAFGLTAPLLLRSDGKKFGKSEKGAVWLSADKTSPYAFYQFWINVDDADVGKYIKLFTSASRAEVEALVAAHEREPHKREAQRSLAREMTTLVHGPEAVRVAESASSALFSGDVRAIDASVFEDVLADVPSTQHARAELDAGVSLLDLLPQTSLASSKREARQFLESGAVAVNGQKATLEMRLSVGDLVHGEAILLKRGKKQWHLTRWA
ncbi:MAG TPA: tyrosine--tRNA ligase [Polyangiales bacterium]|nr:tyrosine--tRNA ligase [Polyangiales bacterium]